MSDNGIPTKGPTGGAGDSGASQSGTERLLAMMGDMANAVAAFTGMRQQLIDAGWQPDNAEKMVIAVVTASAAKGRRTG